MFRKLTPTDVIGKTIQSLENDSINVVVLNFSDGTSVKLWAEEAVRTLAGTIPGIFVEE